MINSQTQTFYIRNLSDNTTEYDLYENFERQQIQMLKKGYIFLMSLHLNTYVLNVKC